MIFNIGKRDFKKYIIGQLSYINLAIIPFQSSRLLSRKQCFWSNNNSLVTDLATLGYRFKFYMTISWLSPVMWWNWSFYWWTDWFFYTISSVLPVNDHPEQLSSRTGTRSALKHAYLGKKSSVQFNACLRKSWRIFFFQFSKVDI